MILHVNACIRPERLSRTIVLTNRVVEHLEDETREIKLTDNDFMPLLWEELSQRDKCIAMDNYSVPYFDSVRDFVNADTIVISAPYWDMSFPSVLKVYLEKMMVLGLSFTYTAEGAPVGLCKAKRLYYITTAGGFVGNYNLGYDYVKALSEKYFGIKYTHCFMAEGLDIVGNNPDGIMQSAINKIDDYFSNTKEKLWI